MDVIEKLLTPSDFLLPHLVHYVLGAHLWQVSRQKHKKWGSYGGGGGPRYLGAPKRPGINRVKEGGFSCTGIGKALLGQSEQFNYLKLIADYNLRFDYKFKNVTDKLTF